MRAKLQRVLQRAHPELWPATPRSLRGRSGLYRKCLRDPDSLMMVVRRAPREGGKVPRLFGMALGRVFHRTGRPSYGRIDDVWVEPTARRRGACRAMVGALLSFFERKRLSLVVLDYAVGNAPAVRTWTALGFEPAMVTSAMPVSTIRRKVGRR